MIFSTIFSMKFLMTFSAVPCYVVRFSVAWMVGRLVTMSLLAGGVCWATRDQSGFHLAVRNADRDAGRNMVHELVERGVDGVTA